MKNIFITVFIFFPTFLFSQNSPYRSEFPLSAKIGFEGAGLDLALGNRFAIDATSLIIYNTFKARYFILEKNASPFIGAGVGKFNGGFGGNGGNQWSVGFVGWEHSYKVFLIQIIIQVPITKQNSYGLSPFFFNLNLGARLH